MSHKNKDSLVKQVEDILLGKLRIGQSRHEAKKDGTAKQYIFSHGTLGCYLDFCCRFVKYCGKTHRCKTVAECRTFVDEYLLSREGWSTYSLKTAACAIGKLYGCPTTDFAPLPTRHRADIVRSRADVQSDRCFSEAKNAPFVALCRSTGLRRREVCALRGGDLVREDGAYYVHVRRGKGGKERLARVIGDVANVVALMTAAGENGKVFAHVPSHADIHGYRRDYARAYYDALARPLDAVPRAERYYCRAEMAGVVFDRVALRTVSQSLGHNRVCVVAENYLDGVQG